MSSDKNDNETPNNTKSNAHIENLIDDFYPQNKALCAKYKKGFGFKTIGYRLPVILTKVIDQLSRDKNEIGEQLGEEARAEVKDIVGALAKLKNEMVTNKPIQRTACPVWNAYLTKVANLNSDSGFNFTGDEEKVRWYVGPWLHVECYMYHRMNSAIQSTKYLQKYDPFVKQKESAFFESVEATHFLGEFLHKSLSSATIDYESLLQTLLEVSLWGNRCDLSISQGEGNSQSSDLLEQLTPLRSNILANDTAKVWQVLQDAQTNGNSNESLNNANNNGNGSGSERSVGLVLDNSAFELFTDLCLADALLASGLVQRVDFYVKAQPWFISDVLVKDFHWTLDALIGLKEERPILGQLGEKWKEHLTSGRFACQEREFWTYPHAFWEMKEADPTLYTELSSHSLLIFKGDLNGRKLIGDINWDFTTPYTTSLQGFSPAPLVGIRTLKADCASGLPPGVGEKLSVDNHDWMNTGEYGIIQFSQ